MRYLGELLCRNSIIESGAQEMGRGQVYKCGSHKHQSVKLLHKGNYPASIWRVKRERALTLEHCWMQLFEDGEELLPEMTKKE